MLTTFCLKKTKYCVDGHVTDNILDVRRSQQYRRVRRQSILCFTTSFVYVSFRHFPALFKEHKSHDVLLMCVACHQRSNMLDNDLKRRLLTQYAPDLTLHDGRRYLNDPALTRVKSAAKWVDNARQTLCWGSFNHCACASGLHIGWVQCARYK